MRTFLLVISLDAFGIIKYTIRFRMLSLEFEIVAFMGTKLGIRVRLA